MNVSYEHFLNVINIFNKKKNDDIYNYVIVDSIYINFNFYITWLNARCLITISFKMSFENILYTPPKTTYIKVFAFFVALVEYLSKRFFNE